MNAHRFASVPVLAGVALITVAAAAPSSAWACSSCGCTLSSDWDSQGFSTQPGFKFDLRYDYINQDQLRSGRNKISPEAASQIVNDDGPQEVEQYTKNRYTTLAIDYSAASAWGVNVQVPHVNRSHATLGTGSDGVSPADEAYESHTSSLGDIKVVGRYQGFTPQRNLGALLGLKLPTGSHTKTGTSTDPNALGEPALIDPGLQPGTGTTDLIAGVYYFDAINQDWDYFAQGTVQTALNEKDDYKPGTGYNLNGGIRYMGWDAATPQLQINFRHALHDTGAAADTVSTGGTLVYLSPGVVVPVAKTASLYGFVQLPIYQDVRGVQLTPKYTFSVGAHFSF